MSDFTPFGATGHLGSGVPRCPECPEGVPTLFPSQNGTSRQCPVSSCVVSRAPRSKGAGHGTGRVSRSAHLALHGCGQHVLTGLDDDRCALVARVDPYPLSAAGEVAALRSSRHTYYLRHGALERRDRWNIPGHPPCPDLLVLAEHVCGTRPPDDWLAPPSPRPSRPAPEEF